MLVATSNFDSLKKSNYINIEKQTNNIIIYDY